LLIARTRSARVYSSYQPPLRFQDVQRSPGRVNAASARPV